MRVTYDVGLGRAFLAHELRAEDPTGGRRRQRRARLAADAGPQQVAERDDCAHHPYPGTYPVVVTDATDWGGWRVPGAEYDRDPRRIEHQARLIACTPALRRSSASCWSCSPRRPTTRPPLQDLARKALAIERFIWPRSPEPR